MWVKRDSGNLGHTATCKVLGLFLVAACIAKLHHVHGREGAEFAKNFAVFVGWLSTGLTDRLITVVVPAFEGRLTMLITLARHPVHYLGHLRASLRNLLSGLGAFSLSNESLEEALDLVRGHCCS